MLFVYVCVHFWCVSTGIYIYIFVCVCRHTQVYVCMCRYRCASLCVCVCRPPPRCVCVCKCQGPRSTLSVVLPQTPSTSFWNSFSLAWNSLIRLDWLVGDPSDPSASSSPVLGLPAHNAIPWCFLWVLGTKLRSSSLQGKGAPIEPSPSSH